MFSDIYLAKNLKNHVSLYHAIKLLLILIALLQ